MNGQASQMAAACEIGEVIDEPLHTSNALPHHLGHLYRIGSFGCATWDGQSCAAVLPVVVELAAVATASEGNHGVGAADCPEHA